MMFSLYYVFIGILVNFIGIAHGQLQALKYLQQGAVDDGLVSSAQFIGVSVPDTGNRFAKADRICVFGVWGLYTTANYGLGKESSTTVISVVGKNSNKLECSSPGQIKGLNQVMSVRYFGNRDASMDGISIVSDAYLLGGVWDVQQSSAVINQDTTDLTAVRLGSIAITGNSSWQLCSDMECKFTVCVDMTKTRYGSLFLNRNTVGDTVGVWPLTIKSVETTSQASCAKIYNPSIQKSLWRSDVGEDSGLDFHKWTPGTKIDPLSDEETDTITTTVIP